MEGSSVHFNWLVPENTQHTYTHTHTFNLRDGCSWLDSDKAIQSNHKKLNFLSDWRVHGQHRFNFFESFLSLDKCRSFDV